MTGTADILRGLADAVPHLAANGRRHDRENTDPADNLALIAGIGAGRLLVPAEFGGTAWDGSRMGGVAAFIRAYVSIASGDGSTGQCFGQTGLGCRVLLAADGAASREVRAELSRRVADDGLRLVASIAETGVDGVTGRVVDGGILLNGTKSFNTNSGGRGMAAVSCAMEDGSRRIGLVELSGPGVRFHDDWDNMGQRGTRSQTITYSDVLVRDGWHLPGTALPAEMAALAMLMHGALLQGIGDGALAATVSYLRTVTRGTLPQFARPAEDPLMMRRLGEVSSRLAASRALLFTTAAEAETAPDVVACMRAKVACAEASLAAANAVHELTGARSTAAATGLDRFWRDARTFASHDPIDAKNVVIGQYELTGTLSAAAASIRV